MNKARLYTKQAWNLMKQNKLFTGIYVVGTALAIAMTMIMAIVYYVKIAPVYPEVYRNRTVYINKSQFSDTINHSMKQYAFSHQALQEWFYPMKDVEAVSAERNVWRFSRNYVYPTNGNKPIEVKMKLTDTGFFRVYPFRFLEGKPFLESDMQSGLQVAVITDDLARRFFGQETGIVGQTIDLNSEEFRIVGVVKAASVLTKQTFAHIYLPYTAFPDYDRPGDPRIPYYGSYSVTILLKDAGDIENVRNQLAEHVRKHNLTQPWMLDVFNQPHSHIHSLFHVDASAEFSWMDVIRRYLLIFLVLLLVPALNLCGMIAGRMDVRLSEMAVRKSFGASKAGLLRQVIWENLLMTLIGGALGLILAWTALVVFREWLFALFDNPDLPMAGLTTEVTGEMLFAPGVFLIALLLCTVLNLLGALVPAWLSLRKPIVQSLNDKR